MPLIGVSVPILGATLILIGIVAAVVDQTPEIASGLFSVSGVGILAGYYAQPIVSGWIGTLAGMLDVIPYVVLGGVHIG